MNYKGIIILFLFCAIFLFQGVFSDFKWQKAEPERNGMSSSKLDALKDTLAVRGTKTFLVIRHDQIVYEWYASEYSPKTHHYTASLAKALVGGLSLMLALNDGRIDVEEPACKYIPQWKGDSEKAKITIRHLATHSSGIEDAKEDSLGVSQNDLPGWKGEFWRNRSGAEAFIIARDLAPIIFTPGTDYHYSNPGMAMLAYAVTVSLKSAPQSNILTLLRERIMRPIGVLDEDWSIGYGEGGEVGGLMLYANWGGGNYTARAVASVGRLMLNKGNWDGKQIVNSSWVEKCIRYAGTPIPKRTEDNPEPGSGLCWWTNFDGVWKSVPRDAFAGAGAGNQILLVVPSLDLIVVRNGSQLGDTFWGGLEKYLFNPLMDAIVNDESYSSPKAVIKDITFASQESIVVKAEGSDNWPITWADDDNLYTAFGDGWGFEPKIKEKLSLGFAKVIGEPTNISGVNIRSHSGEHTGDGKLGKKASGMLMVDDALYMWVRNANNNGEQSQLAWSTDHGQSWRWADWKFEELGYCCFLNFGKDYAGSRDSYVYIYSPDIPSAYEETDEVVLARVLKNQISNKIGYEFFKGLDADSKPEWTKDIVQRRAVFTLKGGCNRLDVVYNAPLRRYLMTMRSRANAGGMNQFSIYESPEPWGPWIQAYYTEPSSTTNGWPGEAQHFPTKWISSNGKTLYMVCSAFDAFSIQKVVLTVDSLSASNNLYPEK